MLRKLYLITLLRTAVPDLSGLDLGCLLRTIKSLGAYISIERTDVHEFGHGLVLHTDLRPRFVGWGGVSLRFVRRSPATPVASPYDLKYRRARSVCLNVDEKNWI